MAVTTVIDTKPLAKKLGLKNDVVYLFYMNGCPHCVGMAEAWKEAKKKSPKCKIVETERMFVEYISDDIKKHIVGYPTILKYKNNKLEMYNKDRTVEGFIKFMSIPKKKVQ